MQEPTGHGAADGTQATVPVSEEGPAAPRSLAQEIDRGFLRALIATGLLLLISSALLVYVLGWLNPAQHRYRLARNALDNAHAGMLDQETGLRGYLIVHDRRLLEPYRQGVATVAREDAALSRQIGSDSAMAPLVLDMRLAQQAWVSQWALVVATGHAPRGRAALDAFLLRGKALLDAYRVKEAALSQRLLQRRDSLYTQETWAFVIAVVATILFGLGLLAMTVRRRSLVREVAVDPVARIVSALSAIAQGDLESRALPGGVSEFRRIGETVAEVRRALVDARDHDRAARERSDAHAAQLHSILTMSREISGSLNLRYALRTIGATAATVSGFARAMTWLTEDDGQTLYAAFDTAVGGPAAGGPRAEVGVGVVGQAVRYGRAVTENETHEPSVEVHAERGLETLALPLVVGAQVRGAIELSSPSPHRMVQGSLEVLLTLASHAAAAIEAARLHGQTEQLAQTDGLTGLANRRRLDADLAAECERARRYRRPLALIMFDVDRFKAFNDAFGHLRGDEVLQDLAEVVSRVVRATDTAYRYGGEEFAVITRETDAEHAIVLAERLRSRIEQHFAAHGSLRPITASFGVGCAPPEQPTSEALLTSADAALYRAKAEGRNRVCGSDLTPDTGSESSVVG